MIDSKIISLVVLPLTHCSGNDFSLGRSASMFMGCVSTKAFSTCAMLQSMGASSNGVKAPMAWL